MKNINSIILLLSLAALLKPDKIKAQSFKDGKLSINEDGSRYLKISLLNQVWLRYNQNNPGTTINGQLKDNSIDIGIRRSRVQIYGPIANRTFMYIHFGINNFNAQSERKAGFFLHDAVGEYEIIKKHLSLGAGLSGWTGLSRFASSSVGTIMGLDLPLYEEATNDVTDQFMRKLSLYAKGKWGRFDYRLIVSDPLAIQKSTAYIANPAAFNSLNKNSANFSVAPAKLQTQAYFQYQLIDIESNLLPYNTGTYLGSKKIFNLGAGIIYQAQAMARLADNGLDTLKSAMRLLSIDAYWDAPLDKEIGTALSAYVALSDYDFGKNYTRNAAPLNPATGNNNPTVLNGSGNGAPIYGTGQNFYAQLGYKMKKNLLDKNTSLMPYASIQYSIVQKLKDPMIYYDAGVNVLLSGHNSKLTIAYQSRPIFTSNSIGEFNASNRKSAVVAQYQVSF